jgi:hypothetical protein
MIHIRRIGEGYITAYLQMISFLYYLQNQAYVEPCRTCVASNWFQAVASSVANLLALYRTTHTRKHAREHTHTHTHTHPHLLEIIRNTRLLHAKFRSAHAWFYALVRFCDFREVLWSSVHCFQAALAFMVGVDSLQCVLLRLIAKFYVSNLVTQEY